MGVSHKLSQHGLAVYTAMFEELRFYKRQQWVITNYLVAIYVAMFTIRSVVDHSSLKAVAFLALIFASIMVAVTQYDLGTLRDRINLVESEYFRGKERDTFGVERKGYWYAYFRRSLFPAGLIAVQIIGFIILKFILDTATATMFCLAV